MKGIVFKATGSWYIVKAGDEKYDCTIKGKLRLDGSKTTNPVVTGDLVDIEIQKGQGVITKIYPRKNYIIRKSTNLSRQAHIIAANLDRAMLIATMIMPETHLEFIDRFLVTAEAYRIPAIIVFNKIDIYTPGLLDYMEEIAEMYKKIGYASMKVSALNNLGIEELKETVGTGISLISGYSGVGKSSLITAIDPSQTPKVGTISESNLSGKHTTTFSEVFELQTGGLIIDTPGIRGFGLVDMEKEPLFHYFPEMFKLLNQCKYYNCTHVHEPGCAVKASVNQGDIAESRYLSYLSMLEADTKYR